QLKLAVTLELFQPAEFGGGLAAPVIVGGVLSMLTVAEAVVLFPALSVAVPVTTWLLPSAGNVTGVGQDAIPLDASEQVKFTVALDLFQPAAFGGGATPAVLIGGVLSRLIVSDTAAVFPALSTAVPVTT